MREATKTGLAPQEYRDEVRRQILEGKLLQLRVRSRVRVTDEDIKSTYSRLQLAERARLNYRLAWVVLRVPHGSTPTAVADREDLGARIAATARAGVDSSGNRVEFADLARSFSDDTPTRSAGGRSRYPHPRRTRSGHRRRSGQTRSRWGVPPLPLQG